MLDDGCNTKKMNIVYFSIILVLLTLSLILIDIYVIKINDNIFQNNRNIILASYQNTKNRIYPKNQKVSVDIVDISNITLEYMQLENGDDSVEIAEEKQKIIENKNENNPWRIKIPKINLDAPIEEGTGQEILAIAVGHFPESSKWNGNVALAGHNRGEYCNFFQNIKKLSIGDTIIYTTDEGTREYKVIMNKIIKETNWEYINNTEDNRITLITCVENMYEYRRCIQAIEV